MEAGYTADDLVMAAAKAGFPDLTTRVITDWVQRGLLDQPTRQSKGRGQGSAKAIYPEEQRNLLLVVLEKRSDSPSITHLLVVPISIWIYWGHEFVPTRQVLRALTTWAKRYGVSSQARARDGIDGLLAQIAHPEATETARNAFTRTLMKAATSKSAVPVSEEISKRISDVVDPGREGRTLGLPGIPLNPEAMVGSWLMRRQAITKLLAHEVRNADLERAREELLQTIAEYAVLQPFLAAADPVDPYASIKASPLELDLLVQNAATDLLLPLAAVLNRRAS